MHNIAISRFWENNGVLQPLESGAQIERESPSFRLFRLLRVRKILASCESLWRFRREEFVICAAMAVNRASQSKDAFEDSAKKHLDFLSQPHRHRRCFVWISPAHCRASYFSRISCVASAWHLHFIFDGIDLAGVSGVILCNALCAVYGWIRNSCANC